MTDFKSMTSCAGFEPSE